MLQGGLRAQPGALAGGHHGALHTGPTAITAGFPIEYYVVLFGGACYSVVLLGFVGVCLAQCMLC